MTNSGKLTDTLSSVDPASVSFSVQGEYGRAQPSGRISLMADGTYSVTVQLEAKRNLDDADGRKYTISVCGREGHQRSAAVVVTIIETVASGQVTCQGRQPVFTIQSSERRDRNSPFDEEELAARDGTQAGSSPFHRHHRLQVYYRHACLKCC